MFSLNFDNGIAAVLVIAGFITVLSLIFSAIMKIKDWKNAYRKSLIPLFISCCITFLIALFASIQITPDDRAPPGIPINESMSQYLIGKYWGYVKLNNAGNDSSEFFLELSYYKHDSLLAEFKNTKYNENISEILYLDPAKKELIFKDGFRCDVEIDTNENFILITHDDEKVTWFFRKFFEDN